MTIVELGRTTAITDRTSPSDAFLRVVRLGPFETDAGLLATFPGLDESGRPVVSVTGVQRADGAVYTEQSTLAGAFARQQSFYWDFGNQLLYIHVAPADAPLADPYVYGSAQGFSSGRPVYIDSIEFLPLLESAPDVRQQQDIENYDRLSFITGSVVINNAGGLLDDLRERPVYGNDLIISHLDDQGALSDDYTSADVTRLATLFVEDYDISLRDVRLRVQDRRKSQNARIPSDRFTSADYPSAEAELLGSVIPVLWGTPREIPAVVTNGTVTSGNVTLRAALLLTALGTVYAGSEDDGWTDVTASVTNLSLATGEFELPAAQGRDASGNPLDVKLVDPTGIAITSLADIIVDANERYLGASFNSSEYDTTEWTAEAAAISSGAYYLAEERELFAVIADIQNGANVGFRYEIAADGRRTLRVDDESRATSASIASASLVNRDSLSVETDSQRLLAEVVVTYGESYVSGRRLRYVDDRSAADVVETYRQRPRKEYATLLTTEADAEERAVFLRDRFTTIRGIGEFVVMGKEYLALRIYDIISVDITPDEPGEDRRPFYGIQKCKILSVQPDATRVTNTITAELVAAIDTRITEDNDIRITEGGVLRALEEA